MSTTTSQSQTRSAAEIAWIRLMRVYQQFDKRSADIMKQYGISVSRFDVLVHAGAVDGRTQQQLADAMFVTKGNITQLLDGMESDGLLYRRRKGRTNLIYLTEKGKECRERTMADQLSSIETLFGVLTCDEREQLSKTLRKVDRHLASENIWKDA